MPVNPLNPSVLGEVKLGDTPRAPIEIQGFRWELTQTPGKGASPLCPPQLLNGLRKHT
jgi:hypothetical protein